MIGNVLRSTCRTATPKLRFLLCYVVFLFSCFRFLKHHEHHFLDLEQLLGGRDRRKMMNNVFMNDCMIW